jgi:hypothetical protein
MRDKKDTPIYSARDDDCEAREQISEFVIRLAERVDRLQDVEGGGQLAALQEHASVLAQDADQLGFELLAEVALRVAEASQHAKPNDAQDALVELTIVARRIRLGHRGAA